MKRFTHLFIASVALFSAHSSLAQTARVQVIHNSADAAAALVDVYLNGNLLLNDFAFRTATPFIDAPAGAPIQIDIAPGTSTSVAQSIYNIAPTLTPGETYVVVADGIVSASGYIPNQPFGLAVFAAGRESASSVTNTDVLVHHGSTDAPTVDVVETTGAPLTIVDDISYPSFSSGYLELPTADYTLAVKDATGTVTVATYGAPLGTLSLQGVALTVVASGFLNPAVNSDGPAFGLYVALPSGGDLIPLPLVTSPTTARVQVIHNSADAAAALVDVYLNGALLINDFAFRTATPFIDAPAGTPIEIDIAPGTSTSVAQSIYNIAPTLAAGETYVVVANGIVSATGYTPAQPFGLSVFAQGRESASSANNTDVLVNHGSTDAPTVDVVESSVPAGTVVDNISFPNFNSAYLELPTADYVLDVKDATGTVTVARYSAPLGTLNLQGTALTVVASGFLNPANNSDGAAFGLWVALPSGGDMIALPNIPLSSQSFDYSTVAISPNPASNVLNINIPFSYDTVSGQIIDISGRAVQSLIKVGTSIDVSNLSNGLYVLDLVIDNKPFKQKFIVNKN